MLPTRIDVLNNRARKIVLWISVPAMLFVLLIWSTFSAGRYYLDRAYHTTVSEWNYSFPSTLRLADIKARPADTLALAAQSATITWRWRDLLHLRRGIHLENVKLAEFDAQITSATYKASVKLSSLYLNQAMVGANQALDSLVVVRPQIEYSEFDSIGNPSKNSAGFVPLDLPGLSIQYFNLASGDVTYSDDKTDHSVSDIQVTATHISSDDLLSLSLEQLALTYQDTLVMDLGVDEAKMDPDFATALNGLHLDLPGFALRTEVAYDMRDSIGTIDIDSSYVTVDLIRRWVPAASAWIHEALPDEERIWIQASAELLPGAMDLHQLAVAILDSTLITGSGKFEYATKPATFEVSRFQVNTGAQNLKQLIAEKPSLAAINWPATINFIAAAQGTMEEVGFHADLHLPKGTVRTQGQSLLGTSMTLDLSTAVHNLPIDELIRGLPVSIPQVSLDSRLHLQLAGKELQSLAGELQILQLPINELQFDTVQLSVQREAALDSLTLSVLDDDLRVEVAALHMDRDTSQLSVSASIDGSTDAIPELLPYLEAGELQLTADYRWHGEDFALGQVIVDKLALKPYDKPALPLYNTSFDYLKSDSIHKAHLQFAQGQYANLHWSESVDPADSLDIFSSIQHADVEFWLDSVWHGQLGEAVWALEMDTLRVDYTDERWEASLAIPHLAFGDYALDSLIYDFEWVDNVQKGLLSATHLENPFLQDLSLELTHNGTHQDTEIELAVMIKESQQAIRVPLRFQTLTDGYALGFSDSLPLTQPDLKWHGVTDQKIIISPDLTEAHGSLAVMARSDREPSIVELFVNHTERNTVLDVLVEHADLEPIKQVVHWPEDLALTGILYADMHLAYRDSLAIEGYVAIDESLLQLPASKTIIKLSEDFIDFDGRQLSLEDFTVYDGEDNPLILNGTVQVMEDGMPFDLTIDGERFIMVKNDDRSGHFSGHLASRASLHATGNMDQINISGEFEILPDAQLAYYPGETAEIVSTHNSISFLDFEDSTANIMAHPPVSHAINWDVEFILNETDFEIILDQESQEFVRFFADGRLELVRGENELPGIFGTIESTKGRAFIGLPTVSDINMIIDRLSLRFDGDVSNPKITFVGHENFPLSPASLDVAFADRQEDVLFQVIFRLDEATPETIEVNFDLTSNDPDVNEFLRSRPADTRTTYAINILAFGALEMFGAGGSDFGIVASKLNELAHRNIKHADLFFQASDVRNQDGTRQRTDFRYSLSKSFMKNRLSVALGGTLGKELAGGDVADLLDDVEINYLLKKDPMLSAKGTHTHRFDDVFDGEVLETTVGLSFLKRFRLKKKGKETSE